MPSCRCILPLFAMPLGPRLLAWISRSPSTLERSVPFSRRICSIICCASEASLWQQLILLLSPAGLESHSGNFYGNSAMIRCRRFPSWTPPMTGSRTSRTIFCACGCRVGIQMTAISKCQQRRRYCNQLKFPRVAGRRDFVIPRQFTRVWTTTKNNS